MIRLFVGADGTNSDLESQAVLEWSVRKNASEPVDIVWMQQAATGPYSGWRCGSARTPFSHFRWSIPAMCNYEGRAIYTDSDFIFVADIAELWHQPIPNVLLTLKSSKPHGKARTCCILFDCAKAKGHVPTLDQLKQMPDPQGTCSNYFRANDHLMDRYQGEWNARDPETLSDPRIKAIHYTRMEHQVHLKHALPRLKAEGRSHWYTGPVFQHPNRELQALFDVLLAEAIAHGYTPERYRVKPFVGATRRPFAYKHHKGVAVAS